MAGWASATLLSLVALQWLLLSGASHFRFGSISWTPADSHSNTIRFTFRLAFRRSASSYSCDQSIINNGILLGSGGRWKAKCVNYYGYDSQCHSANIANTGYRCTDYSSNEDWSMGENNFTHSFPYIHEEWLVSYYSCCWIPLSGRYGSSNWLVSTTVNLTRRSDNGRINSSPKSRSPAIVRWYEGCPSSLRIPVEDPDGDVVKCRFANYSESYKYSDSFPYGILDEKTCVLTYNGSNGAAGTYVVALTLEDFPAATTNFGSVSPFSAVGLQFLVRISSHSGSCNNVPVFTGLTPQDGECSEVQIGSAYKTVIEVKLADFSKHIVEIETSSPPGMQLTSLRYHGGVYYRNVTWYPGQYQVGQQSFCFKAVDSSYMGTEWRCATILVGISSTPHVITGSHTPRNPIIKSGPGFIWFSIQFDRVIKKPRTSSYIRLVLLPTGHTVYKVDTLSQYAVINSDHTTLQFAMPNAALSMNGSYAITIDHGAVVGQGCSYDGPPTPGITNTTDWQFGVDGVCPLGYYLAPPEFKNCVDMNECGSHSRSKRSNYYWWWNYYTISSSIQQNTYAITPTTSSSYVPYSILFSGSCSRHIYAPYYAFMSTPGYPGCYPNNEVCTWLIEAPVGYYVELHLYDFNLEYGGSSCPWDYLEIRDGNAPSSSLITKACGSLGYFVIYSSGRFLFLRFVSDGIIPMSGFSAWCTVVNQRYSNVIPSAQLSSSRPISCVSSHTPSTWFSTSSSITPTTSSSYVPYSDSYPDNRVGFNNSVILGKNPEHLANFTNLTKPVVQNGNDWKLCWRASQDGWASTRFHSLCDGKGPTITIIKVGQYIFGGYTSIPWSSNCGYRYDSQAFLFSLVNKPGWAPLKLNQHSYYYSIYSCAYYGPTFGGGHDIYISNYASTSSASYSYPYSYSIPGGYYSGSYFAETFLAGSHSFAPDEIEIFYDKTFSSQATPFPTTSALSATMSVPTTTRSPLAITPTTSSSYVPYSVSYPDNRVGFNNSVILGKNPEHLANFTNLTKPVVQNGNDWKLCWRASQDGWASTRFHSLCDGKGPTITIIKVGQYIFGGYTSISWSSYCSYRYDPEAFLFSLVNKPGWAPVKLNQSGQYSYYKHESLYSCSSYGPTFGGGHDIYISSYASSYWSYSSSYLGYTYSPPSGYSYGSYFTSTYLAGSYHFFPDEIEIFYDQTFTSPAPPFPTSKALPTTISVPTTTTWPQAFTPTTSSSYVPYSVSYPDNRVGFNNSVILGKNPEHLANFTNLTKPVVQNGNDWKLCWRASHDGWASTRFHSLCDGKGPTITIIKVGQYIFGGYTSISWSSYCSYRYDPQAFLFSLVNNPGWAPVKLNQSGQYSYYKSHSVYSCSSYGPTFGGSHDIYISSYASSYWWYMYSYSSLGYTYSPPSGYSYGSNFARSFLAGSYHFVPDEIEIFYDQTFTSQAPPFPTSKALPTTISVPTTTTWPQASQIAPTSSSLVSSSHYTLSSSYALPTPVDFQLHVPAECAQICTNTPGSYSCSCVSGYRLHSDEKSCLDIDECATNNGGCSHQCYNLPGSFYCGCPEGTTMAADNFTCVEPGVTVTCDENNMTVSLEKQTFPFFKVSELHLSYRSCRATQNSTHILISTPLNGCGTLVNETEEELIFWNKIQVTAVIIDNVITRTHDINLPFYCSYSRRKMLSLSFNPRNIFIGLEAGYGNFTFTMDFYKTAAFATPYHGNDYPLEVSLNENLYLKLSVESSATLVIMPENCRATKKGNYYSLPQYTIIQNGCPRDTDMQYSYDPYRSYQYIIIPAFRFFNDYDEVYFHCELLACYKYNSNSRCSKSCLNSKRRKRRNVNRDELEQEESTTKHILTSGPIRKKSENTKKSDNGDTGQSKQAAMIGGAAAAGGFGLIAVVALAVLFVKYRIARRMMNRNKVGDLYTTKEEQMSRKNAYIQEDDMIEKEDSF